MSSVHFIVQIIGWVGTVVNTFSYQAKNTIQMVLLQALAGLIYGTHYMLLRGVTAGFLQYIFTGCNYNFGGHMERNRERSSMHLFNYRDYHELVSEREDDPAVQAVSAGTSMDFL